MDIIAALAAPFRWYGKDEIPPSLAEGKMGSPVTETVWILFANIQGRSSLHPSSKEPV
jgi:hypothetical protein